MLIYSKDRFNLAHKQMCENKQPHSIVLYRDERILVVDNKDLYKQERVRASNPSITTKNKKEETKKKRQEIAFYGQVKRQINNFIKKQDYNIRPIENTHPVREKTNKHEDIKIGDRFLSVDIRNCYWQLMYKFGYINENLFEKYNLNEDYKKQMLMSLTITVSVKTKQFYFDTFIPHTPDLEVDCENQIYQVLFDNVRYTTYNIMGDIANNVLGGDFINYNTDGIYIKLDKKELSKVVKALNKQGLRSRTTICEKISKTEFRKVNDIKSF